MTAFDNICRCGALHLRVLVPRPSSGNHVTCYCQDCQTAARLHKGGSDILSDAGGTNVWQTTPDRIEIVKGRENLQVLRLSPRGTYRWHAACCGTPLMNTLANLKLPFVGVVLRQSRLPELSALIGPSVCQAFTTSARPGMDAPGKDVGFKRAGAAVLRRMALGLLSGRAKRTPLHDGTGTPIAAVEIIPLEARQAALPVHLK